MPATKINHPTPGPWKSVPPGPGVPASASIVPIRGRYPVAEVMLDADAPLIAAAPDLLDELVAAHRIIQNALSVMTPEQKRAWGSKNDLDDVAGEGIIRANERAALIARAGGCS